MGDSVIKSYEDLVQDLMKIMKVEELGSIVERAKDLMETEWMFKDLKK